MEEIIERVLERLDDVITKVETLLPIGFPEDLSEPIFEGMRDAKRRL